MKQCCRTVALAFYMVLLMGAMSRGPVAETELVKGTYHYMFEVSALNPCGTEEMWWVEETPPDFYERYREASNRKPVPVYVEVRGVKSAQGHWGHMGAYERRFKVTEIVKMEPLAGDPCRAPSP